MSDAYAVGIEEEYFLVDAETKTVSETRPEAFFGAAKEAIGSSIKCEMRASRDPVAINSEIPA